MENPARKEMVKNLSDIVIPVLRQKGFKGSFPHFRRLTTDRINLLTFQFDRSGGGFLIEIANCEPSGFTTSWGTKIEPNKLTAHDLFNRKRIQSNMDTTSSLTEDWFRYDKKYLFGFGDIYKKVCKDVLSKLHIAEDYWKKGELSG
jgi:hypothetical protein